MCIDVLNYFCSLQFLFSISMFCYFTDTFLFFLREGRRHQPLDHLSYFLSILVPLVFILFIFFIVIFIAQIEGNNLFFFPNDVHYHLSTFLVLSSSHSTNLPTIISYKNLHKLSSTFHIFSYFSLSFNFLKVLDNISESPI